MAGARWRTMPPRVRAWRRAMGTALLIALCPALAACSGPSEASTLTGTWTGTYNCNQGETGLRLVINANSDGKLTATFSFFAVPSNPGVPSGEFSMTGSFTAKGENFTQQHWIRQSAGYEMINLSAGPPANGGTVLNGNVSFAGCTTFSVKKG